jgi:hypothetical protein
VFAGREVAMNRKLVYTCVLTLLALVTVPVLAEKEKVIAEFRAFAVNMTGGPRTSAGVVQIGIFRWSTEDEREALLTTLQEKGSGALIDALMKQPEAGYIKMPNTLGWTLFYARQTQEPDGSRKIVLATNRKLTFGEVSRQTRSAEYDFTLVEIHMPADGKKGEGKLAAAAKVTFNNKTRQVEVENYGAMPVDLKDVSEETKK